MECQIINTCIGSVEQSQSGQGSFGLEGRCDNAIDQYGITFHTLYSIHHRAQVLKCAVPVKLSVLNNHWDIINTIINGQARIKIDVIIHDKQPCHTMINLSAG